jgi:hypothetical protein
MESNLGILEAPIDLWRNNGSSWSSGDYWLFLEY